MAASLWTDTELHSSICLDGIITVVDTYNLRAQLSDPQGWEAVNEAERQLAYADVILLNKVSSMTYCKLLMPFSARKTSLICVAWTNRYGLLQGWADQRLVIWCFRWISSEMLLLWMIWNL